VCESDPKIKEKITTVLEVLEYHITDIKNSREALKKMRYHVYDLICINEFFDTRNPDQNGILIYLERLNMAIRRQMFIALISNRFRTMDQMVAFQKSINIVININNIDDFDKILRRALADNEMFYRIFKEQEV
jgi:DNA-binding response OmpR family regulator